jgi:hypothetical protein
MGVVRRAAAQQLNTALDFEAKFLDLRRHDKCPFA